MWLVGLTGAGKSYLAKLFMNFFGDFPVSSGRFTTWSSTPNYIQRQGYFFKDALFLVDDFKPEVIQPYQVVRILQTYADSTARGRFKSDSTTNIAGPFAACWCTGEDVPEHNASALARSVVVKVPQRSKDIEPVPVCCRVQELLWAHAGLYSLADRQGEDEGLCRESIGPPAEFVRRCCRAAERQSNYSEPCSSGCRFRVDGRVPERCLAEWQEQSGRFIEVDLVAIRGELMGEAKEQQASEVFVATLAELIRYQQVCIEGHPQLHAEGKEVIGRWLPRRFVISTKLAMAAVNECLRRQGRSLLRVSEQALLKQLREDDRLWQEEGNREVETTRRVRIEGRQVRSFAIEEQVLLVR